MGRTTDELVALAGRVAAAPDRDHRRELDMLLTAGERIAMALLAMAIREAGVEAISFTGSQAAIITDTAHTGARIEEVRGRRVREELAAGRVVIVAGFQGVSREREVTTLGRGGSDTTAVALAAALGADRCDIFTDVDGVYSADPRVVPGARRIPAVDYAEMTEMAVAGARVVHPRAVELAARFRVPVRVLSTFSDDDTGGTLIADKERSMEDPILTGVASEAGYVRLVLRGLPPAMASMTDTLRRLTEAGVSVDLLSQLDVGGRRDLQLTIREDDLEAARRTCGAILDERGGEALEVRDGLARVTLAGSGMHKRPGVYARAFETLEAEDIDVHAVSASSVSILLVVNATDEDRAVRALHRGFGLDGETA